jgi:hypothetical protein
MTLNLILLFRRLLLFSYIMKTGIYATLFVINYTNQEDYQNEGSLLFWILYEFYLTRIFYFNI